MTDQNDPNLTYWQRPPASSGPPAPAGPTAPSGPIAPAELTVTQPTSARNGDRPSYAGPPKATPPPPGWRPQTLIEISAPRTLPNQDHESIDSSESAARSVTLGIGMLASAVLVILLVVVLVRLRY